MRNNRKKKFTERLASDGMTNVAVKDITLKDKMGGKGAAAVALKVEGQEASETEGHPILRTELRGWF